MKRILTLVLCLLVMTHARAQTNSPAVRLAIISESPATATAADLLTVEFSKNDGVHLLERTDIEKIYREQSLSVANKDYSKLGQILGADGLLILNIDQQTNLTARLIATKPGVILAAESFAWPLKDMTGWAPLYANRLNSLLPKLSVLAKDAIPISVVNLRSAIQSDEAKETERQLKLLAIQRLTREPQLFVLERQQMQLLADEKEFKTDDSPFWNGSYLLDGTVDRTGYAKDTVTISARLAPPRGGEPILIEVTGSRSNLTEVVNELVVKVIASLKINSAAKEWNAGDEAAQYFDEAKWALKWKIYGEAQAAAESALALGRQDHDTAILLVRAYAESVGKNWLNADSIKAVAFPDAGEFAPLNRALEVFTQNAPLFAAAPAATNGAAFFIGVQLLMRATGLLESYYYAAEARAGCTGQLQTLRENTRRGFRAMELFPISKFGRLNISPDPRQRYQALKWEEGGIAYDRPEDALPYYLALLISGAHPEQPPRLVGWSWPDRQQVPALHRRFVTQACAETNPAVRLEALYQALLSALDDGQGGLERSEADLESAMWENREILFANAGNASLIERARNALDRKFHETPLNKEYGHEPFDSVKHRLRMDFLTRAAATNMEVLQELFPGTGQKTETPERARELLPLAETLQSRLKFPQRVAGIIQNLRDSGGVIAVASLDSNALPPLPPETPVEAKFINWNLPRPNANDSRVPDFSGMIFRNGQLWVRVRYLEKVETRYWADFPTTYLAVDVRAGVRMEIPFPEKFGVPGDAFEVTADALFVVAGDHLYEYLFREKIWSEIPAPVQNVSQLIWLGDRLFINRDDGLLAVQPGSNNVQLLVSSRRIPSANEIDPQWAAGALIYGQADGRLGVLAGGSSFAYDPAKNIWNTRPKAVTGPRINSIPRHTFLSPAGAECLLSDYPGRNYLLGFGDDDLAPENLLTDFVPLTKNHTNEIKSLWPARWDWPRRFPLESARVVAGDEKLWVLSPRKAWGQWTDLEPVKFSDSRQATLFCFTRDFRPPLSAPIHFEEVSPDKPFRHVPGGGADMLLPPDLFRAPRRDGNYTFWVKTPGGFVYGSPIYCGHWFIPAAALEEEFQPQRQQLLSHSKLPATSSNPSTAP